jgi:hypothetical protein
VHGYYAVAGDVLCRRAAVFDFAACRRLSDAPSDQAVRDALAALCPPAETLEQPLNASFARRCLQR